MKQFVSNTTFLSVQEYDLIQSCLESVSRSNRLKQNDDLQVKLNEFQTFVGYLDQDFIGAFEYHTSHSSFTIQLNKFYYHLKNTPSKFTPTITNGEIQMWVCFQLNKDFGCHLLRYKTLTDRFISLLTPLGHKFKEDKLFNRKFMLLTNDAEKLSAFFNEPIRHELIQSEIKPLYLEVKNDKVVFGTKKPIELSMFSKIVELVNKIARVTQK